MKKKKSQRSSQRGSVSTRGVLLNYDVISPLQAPMSQNSNSFRSIQR